MKKIRLTSIYKSLLILSMLLIFTGCASTPTTKLPDGSAGYVVQLNAESAFLLPAEFFKITENDGYWSIWNKESHSSIKLCKNKSAVSRAYSSYTGGRDYDVISSQTTKIPLGKDVAEGEIVVEILSINGHSSHDGQGNWPRICCSPGLWQKHQNRWQRCCLNFPILDSGQSGYR